MSSEDFKRAIRAGKLSEAFLLAISKAPELSITTWIAAPDADEERVRADNSLRTQINLVAGEINNVVGEKMVGNLHPEIERVHVREVERARETIRENLETVREMLRSLATFQSGTSQFVPEELPATSPIADETSDILEPTTHSEANLIAEDIEAETVAEENINTKAYPIAEDTVAESVVEEDSNPDEIYTEEVIETSTAADEDWGDWLEEDSTSNANRDRSEPTDEW